MVLVVVRLAITCCPLSQGGETVLFQVEIVFFRASQHPPLLGVKQEYDAVNSFEDLFVELVALGRIA